MSDPYEPGRRDDVDGRGRSAPWDPEPQGLIGSDPYAPPRTGDDSLGGAPAQYRYGPAHGFGRYGASATQGMKAEYIQPGTPLPVAPGELAANSKVASFAHWGTMLIGFWAPLIVYLMKKDESPYTRLHASESLNFMVIMLIGYAIAGALSAILIGVFALPVLFIWQLVAVIGAAGAANRGEMPKYWLPFRVFS